MNRLINAIVLICFFGLTKAQMYYSDGLKNKLDSAFSSITPNEPGFSIHIEKGNQLLYSASFGSSNIENNLDFTTQTLVNIGGISKVFISYAILILQQQGKLSIEDSLVKYIPHMKNKEIGSKVKIRHLLMHTSGFKDLPPSITDSVFSLTMNDEQNFELVKYCNKLSFDPGSNYQFSDQAFSALVLIIEKVSKQKWQDFIKDRILMPTGMTFSKLTKIANATGGVSTGYMNEGGKFKEYDEFECPKMFTASNAGVWSNIEDLRKFMYALKDCLFLKCETVKLSQEILLSANWYSPITPPHGLCWFSHPKGSEFQNFYFDHKGNIGGFRSHIIYFPDKDLTLIWLGNSSRNITPEILSALVSNKFIN